MYPKAKAIALAKATNTPVLFTAVEIPLEVTEPIKLVDAPVVAELKRAPIMAIKPTGEEVQLAQVVTPPPAAETQVVTAPASMAQENDAPGHGKSGSADLRVRAAVPGRGRRCPCSRETASVSSVSCDLSARRRHPSRAARGAPVKERTEQYATESYPATGRDHEAPAEWERLLRDQGSRPGRAQFSGVEQGDGLHCGGTEGAGPHGSASAGYQYAGDSGQARLHPVRAAAGCVEQEHLPDRPSRSQRGAVLPAVFRAPARNDPHR